MKLAIIGAGNVGGTLGKAWAEKGGHDVCRARSERGKDAGACEGDWAECAGGQSPGSGGVG
ncbi:MAG: NAD(P)-binding domain-containing protein [Pseudolabrys sp.]